MNFSNQPIGALLRGPLLTNPEGWIVIASAVFYMALAMAYGVFGMNPPMGKTVEVAVTRCLAWPFIVFLMFIKNGLPSFTPSLGGAAFIALCALFPVLFVVWRAL